MKVLMNFVNDDRGVDLIEYALLAGLIGVVAVGALGFIGTRVNEIYVAIQGKLDDAVIE
jgi:pilus assembly protein Flp/PilA